LTRTSVDEVRSNLHAAILTTCTQAQISVLDLDAAFIALGGVGREAVRRQAADMVREVLQCRFEVRGDMEAALEAAFKGGAGVVVVSGTGSIVLGRNARGLLSRAGGWGPVISDEGSGYWIGQRAVAETIRTVDSGRTSILVERVRAEWNAASFDELIVMANAQSRPNFAALFPVVLACAQEGDAMAKELLTEAAVELAKLTRNVIRRLWPGREGVRIAMTGGVFKNSAAVRQVFENAVRAERPEAEISLLTEAPVMGALFRAELLALKPSVGA
jgi:N-acetylglucosamine kinase-like BadF-type ATPase